MIKENRTKELETFFEDIKDIGTEEVIVYKKMFHDSITIQFNGFQVVLINNGTWVLVENK